MRNRTERVRELLRQAVSRRRLLEADVAALSAGAQALAEQFEQIRAQALQLLDSPGGPTAAAAVNREGYRGTLAAEQAQLAAAMAAAQRELAQRREALPAAANGVRVWEQLLERLELAETLRARRRDQNLLEEYSQRHSPRG
jgi:flagellar export protein FliJ